MSCIFRQLENQLIKSGMSVMQDHQWPIKSALHFFHSNATLFELKNSAVTMSKYLWNSLDVCLPQSTSSVFVNSLTNTVVVHGVAKLFLSYSSNKICIWSSAANKYNCAD